MGARGVRIGPLRRGSPASVTRHGPAPERAGTPFVDNLYKTEERWDRLLAGERFEDEPAPRF